MNNKTILEKANAAVSEGDHETFLSYCTDNTKWTFVGDRVISGKEKIRQYMADAYKKPPKFDVDYIIAEADYVTAVGTISLFEDDNQWVDYYYCDVWRFENGKMAELRAFVIEK
ncbi:nuclear transport factor 2 family protein [Chryseobacterium chendengshani]|uniref:nuclear transport factor 2 family protein n=1 Tax=unclassified Chryseobacterium TaxID=2593645 RepID=UPI001C641E95|nr:MULTISPECIES: nuclear transport factor 2 family protein [unclassified Chryseobacterium]MBW7674326.1 nuclear transport factor 2 family protein [Chryseobacterium sp. LJ756]MBW8522885.1 nuclear transport factor 2 family protein [Chryseobacterium sp. LJ668]QYK16415.1 nuclear transport factor 2 family protein [Chryseobacterium sp. LJ668]